MRITWNIKRILKVIKNIHCLVEKPGRIHLALQDAAQGVARLEKGEVVDFEAENQQMSDYIEEKTAALLDKVLLRASNLMVNHYSVSD